MSYEYITEEHLTNTMEKHLSSEADLLRWSRNSPHFVQLGISLPSSQETNIRHYVKPVESSSYSYTVPIKDTFKSNAFP
jgi:hypothetical protein